MRAQEDTTTRIETDQRQRNAGRMPRGLRDSAHWLIAKNQNGHIEVLTIRCGREKALPVFSFEEEAEMFLRFGSVGEHWRLRESRAGELLSVLYGACPSVKKVALDPLPEMAADGSADLVSLDRRLFIERIMAGQGGPSIPADGRVFRRPATHLV